MIFSASIDGSVQAASAGCARARGGGRAFLALLLLCLLVQATVVQSHLHFIRQASVAADSHSTLSKPGKPDPVADCPFCQEAAMAGAYVLPPLPDLPPPPPQILWLAAASLVPFALLAPAQGWLSRAPPE